MRPVIRSFQDGAYAAQGTSPRCWLFAGNADYRTEQKGHSPFDCLTDETRTKEPIEDYWPVTTVGDVAFFFLCGLFTDSSWQHSTIDGVVNWKTLEAEYPHQTAFNSWYSYLKKHGRKHVQDVWYKRWSEVEHTVAWDAREQCFMVDQRNNGHRL
jgi:hypothetical protein